MVTDEQKARIKARINAMSDADLEKRYNYFLFQFTNEEEDYEMEQIEIALDY
jgi:hypothetical protein